MELLDRYWVGKSGNKQRKYIVNFRRVLLFLYTIYKLIRSNIYGKTAYWIKAEISECQEISIEKILLNCVPVMQCESIESFCSDPVVETIKLDHKNIIELQIYINTSKRNEEEKWECLSHGWTLDNAEGLIKFSPKISLNPNSRTIKLKYCCGGGKAGNISARTNFCSCYFRRINQQCSKSVFISGGN